jgi:hypothetical protein
MAKRAAPQTTAAVRAMTSNRAPARSIGTRLEGTGSLRILAVLPTRAPC